MKLYHKLLLLNLIYFGFITSIFAQNVNKLESPDKKIVIGFEINDAKLFYNVKFNGKSVINPSLLDLVINDQSLGAITAFGTGKRDKINETYTWRGIHSKAKNQCNTIILEIKGSNHSTFNIEARAFNEGIAFRYVINNNGFAKVNADETLFIIPKGSKVWSQKDIKAYEGRYTEQLIDTIPIGQLAGPPLTFKLPNNQGFASITEGGLTAFAGMSLISVGNNAFKANLTGTVSKNGVIETPWRIVTVANNLNALVNADIVQNVSPAYDEKLFPKGFNTEWIKPGRSVWSWLAGNGGVTFENMKKYSKWAGELGFEYNLVDEGWSKWKDGGKSPWELVKDLVDYSAQQNVKIWIWKAYPNRDGVPGLKDQAARLDFFKKCKEAGVVGLKIDFFDTESQEVINFYQAALKDAAEMHLMLDFHGSNKPTGETRTWPNEMSREGIRGLENGTSWPKHNTTLLFTRYLAGHGDYTPLSFRTVTKGTTVTHQVATMAAFNSPFMCLAVNPEALLSHPSRKMVSAIPLTWDETIVLPNSEIGALAVLAKRSGKTWYLVVLNGDSEKKLTVDLSFLGKGAYKTSIMEDVEGKFAIASIQENVLHKNTDKVKLNLQRGGGYIASFTEL